MDQWHGTTILCVRRGRSVAMGGDGQVTLGNVVIKATARKVRRLYQEKILAGFAGGGTFLGDDLMKIRVRPGYAPGWWRTGWRR